MFTTRCMKLPDVPGRVSRVPGSLLCAAGRKPGRSGGGVKPVGTPLRNIQSWKFVVSEYEKNKATIEPYLVPEYLMKIAETCASSPQLSSADKDKLKVIACSAHMGLA